MSGVEIDSLTISYVRRGRPLRVIDDVSLRIAPGEAYGLVGESGCGKTTVAMALMRYLPPNAVVDAGRIVYGGEDVLTLDERRLRRLRGDRIAMVYQDPASALNPSMRIGEQIAEVFVHHRGLEKAAALAEARGMLDKVRIGDPDLVLRRYPHQLSGGQQQRVVIAMALATDPDLLVLDEPTTALDATVEAEVLDLVERLRDELGTAILFISHNLGIVARMCERVGVLYAGRLIEEGPARELFSDPRHPYTAALLRCLPRPGIRKAAGGLEPIPGALPALGTDTGGCVYADRRPLARDRCRAERPPLIELGPGRASRCFYSDEVPAIAPARPSLPATGVAGERDPGAPLLRIEDLEITYGARGAAVTAVAGVSLEVERGEVLGIVGESGSGKTSLAKSVVGLVEASGGRIRFEDVDLTAAGRRRDAGLRRNLQMVFQNPDSALNPRHSIRRILGRSLRLLGRGDAGAAGRERRLVELAESVRLDARHLDQRPGALSGGLKQRVAIARSFAGSPAMVICDEPASALDVSVQAAILNLLVELQRTRGTSYIFISHDLAVVRYVADRIGVMYLGQLIDVGPTEEVFAPPHHPYTEALVSAIPSLDLERPAGRVKLEGAMPSLSDPPSGCRFHTRCPRFLGERCERTAPPWQRLANGRMYRCHIEPAELAALQEHHVEPSERAAR